jgi:hypothetical protein
LSLQVRSAPPVGEERSQQRERSGHGEYNGQTAADEVGGGDREQDAGTKTTDRAQHAPGRERAQPSPGHGAGIVRPGGETGERRAPVAADAFAADAR